MEFGIEKCSLLYKILWALLGVDEEETQTDWPKNQVIDDHAHSLSSLGCTAMFEGEEEEDSSALRIASMQGFRDSRNIPKNSKEKLITESSVRNITRIQEAN